MRIVLTGKKVLTMEDNRENIESADEDDRTTE